jgi:hypothetical protein
VRVTVRPTRRPEACSPWPATDTLQRLIERKRLRAGGGAEALATSISRIPDHGVEIFVILTGSPAEIGVELFGPTGRIPELVWCVLRGVTSMKPNSCQAKHPIQVAGAYRP